MFLMFFNTKLEIGSFEFLNVLDVNLQIQIHSRKIFVIPEQLNSRLQ